MLNAADRQPHVMALVFNISLFRQTASGPNPRRLDHHGRPVYEKNERAGPGRTHSSNDIFCYGN